MFVEYTRPTSFAGGGASGGAVLLVVVLCSAVLVVFKTKACCRAGCTQQLQTIDVLAIRAYYGTS
jgi:hypothetical protein